MRAKNERTGEHNAIYNVQKKDENLWLRARTHMASIARSFTWNIFRCIVCRKVRFVSRVIFRFALSVRPTSAVSLHTAHSVHGKPSEQAATAHHECFILHDQFSQSPQFSRITINKITVGCMLALLCSALRPNQREHDDDNDEKKY